MKPTVVVDHAQQSTIHPWVHPARMKRRHVLVTLSFILIVVFPTGISAWYLWTRAQDQYASHLGFSVRKEEAGSAVESLLGIAQLSGSSSSDTDVLYEYLQSQDLVEAVAGELDLQQVWVGSEPNHDPFFSYDTTGTIEDLLRHWNRKVQVDHDTSTGLIEVRVLSFDPVDSWAVNELIYKNSSLLINKLSAIAREDAVIYAEDELAQAEARLKSARLDLLTYRSQTQIVDPRLQTQAQSGLISALETQLAEAQIDLALLQQTTRAKDPRLTQTERRITVIEDQIERESAKLGLSQAGSGDSVAILVGEFEALTVELEFAQQAYVAAQVALDSARNEARRQSRYLAAHVAPTLAERAEYPQRELLLFLTALFCFLGWSSIVLISYAIWDRR